MKTECHIPYVFEVNGGKGRASFLGFILSHLFEILYFMNAFGDFGCAYDVGD